MPFSPDDNDEIRLLIAREIRDFVKSASNAVLNPTIELGEAQHAMSPEGQKESEAQKKIAQKLTKAIIDKAEANLREADARIVEKTDPARADIIRKLVPTY
jgi:hypothetical protein